LETDRARGHVQDHQVMREQEVYCMFKVIKLPFPDPINLFSELLRLATCVLGREFVNL
jgi:hypothetical protein